MISIFALVAGAILNQGCAVNNAPRNMVWSNPDKTPQQIAVDEAQCRIMARQLAPNTPIATDSGGIALLEIMNDNSRVQNIYNDCMISKGYILIKDTNAQPQTVPHPR